MSVLNASEHLSLQQFETVHSIVGTGFRAVNTENEISLNILRDTVNQLSAAEIYEMRKGFDFLNGTAEGEHTSISCRMTKLLNDLRKCTIQIAQALDLSAAKEPTQNCRLSAIQEHSGMGDLTLVAMQRHSLSAMRSDVLVESAALTDPDIAMEYNGQIGTDYGSRISSADIRIS